MCLVKLADECVANCHGVPYASCYNVPGDYLCNCSVGYDGDGHTCEGSLRHFSQSPALHLTYIVFQQAAQTSPCFGGPFHGAIAVPSVTRCRRCRRGHRCAGGVRQWRRATVATPGEWQCKTARSGEWAQHFSNDSCYILFYLFIYRQKISSHIKSIKPMNKQEWQG